jgi:hypothetical protein
LYVFSGSVESVLPNGSHKRPLAILGLQLSKLSVKRTGYFSDKTEIQKSSTVLGYAAHLCVHYKNLTIPLYLPEGFELLIVYVVFYSIFRFGGDMTICLFVLNHRQFPSLRHISMFLFDILCALGVQGHMFLIMHHQLI